MTDHNFHTAACVLEKEVADAGLTVNDKDSD